MARRSFDEWLQELRVLVEDRLESKLEDLPEFDKADARMYFRDKSAPIMYFDECLAESGEFDTSLSEIVSGK